ncbi:hypothetical protein PYCCODRAFT_1467075 [Trametes coccinea BRFM310]|uniref:RRM domain-containing protein n=1 Tax=Trametes coccinea (strain BRFM310) TaxID=1353009 RepID=A0A1Y2IQ03_TRAC3|nr:hypothetical protein PYCCODRAFT_1467075 [Trametes coccinea BRFM310]
MSPHAIHDRTLFASTALVTDFSVPAPDGLYPLRRPDAASPSPIIAEPPTPTSTVTMRRQNASSSSSEDDILPTPSISRSPQRSSSRTYKWVEDQQQQLGATTQPSEPEALPGARCHPYLAYPQLSAASLVKGSNKDTIRTVESYVFVDDDHERVAQPTERVPRGRDASVTQPASRSETPSTPRKSFRASQGIFHSGSPLRSLHLTFTSRRPSAPASSASLARPHSPASSTTSTFRRNPAASHSRGSSLSTVNALHQRSARTESPELSTSPPKTTAWKFKRPSVAGHFSPMPENDSAEQIPPPRPSTSSSVTHSGSSTVYTRTSSDAPRKMYFGSIRSHSSTTIFSASPSLWSLPTDASHINDPPESEKVIARDRLQSASEGSPIPWKPSPSTVPHMGSVTSLLTSPRSRSKKRKLIISGIPPDDERRFEGVRKWCESFGELNSITRAPNGDLHIDFRKAEVADTVCRLNARVYIAGVGSVCLSWFTGKRP